MEPKEISLSVLGLGLCTVRELTKSATHVLEDWRRTSARGASARRLDAIIAAALVSPSIPAADVSALPTAARGRLRWAILDINDARTDYLRLRGTKLGLDERALVALEVAHRAQVRRLIDSIRTEIKARMQVKPISRDLQQASVKSAAATASRTHVTSALGAAFGLGGVLGPLSGFQGALPGIAGSSRPRGLPGISAALDGVTKPFATSVTRNLAKSFGLGLSDDLARIARGPSAFANVQQLVTGRAADRLSSIIQPMSTFTCPREPWMLGVSAVLRDALRPVPSRALGGVLDGPIWRELDELWERAKGHLFEWLFSHLGVRTLRAVLSDDSTMERAAIEALTDIHALAVVRQSVAEAVFLSDQNRRWLMDGLGRLIAGDDADLAIPSLMSGTEGAARDLARHRGLLTRRRGKDLITLSNGKPKSATAMDHISDLILVEDGHAQLVVEAYGRGNGYRHGAASGASAAEIQRHVATVLLVLIGVLDEAGSDDPLSAVVLVVETSAHERA